jgi:integrase
MRRTQRIDLASVDISTLPLPDAGEYLIHDMQAPGLALRLRASGARSWVTLCTHEGKTLRRSLGDALKVPAALARTLHSTATPALPTGSAVPALYPANATVNEVMAGYLAFGENRRWKASTGKTMEIVSRLHIAPAFGEKPVCSMTRSDVVLWLTELEQCLTSSRMALSTLSGMMVYAEDHGLRPPGSNPCKGLRKKALSTRGSYLSPNVIAKLWAALDRYEGHDRDACDAVRLLMLTGARKMEILGMEWDAVTGPCAVLEDAKAGPRAIWFNTPAQEIIERRRALGNGKWVFPSRSGNSPRRSLDRGWSHLRNEAGAPALRLHDLRHHFAAVGVSNGIDLKFVGALLGHHDIDSTLIYAHLATASLAKSAGRVSKLIDQAMRGAEPEPDGASSRSTPPPGGANAPVSSEASEVCYA